VGGVGGVGDVAPLADAAAAIGMPLHVIAVDDPAVARLYERQLVLVRQDGMVAWRGDSLPDDLAALVATVSGNAPAAAS
jgi:FAD-dependent monooxygenase